jgi:catechol 2,3-dioxygenase-like lactoylglutathione lyase family enzyme
MKTWTCVLLAPLALCGTPGQAETLPPPGFHHLHLNSVDPNAAIDFYTRQFPSTVKSSFAGSPALQSGKVFVLFNKVNTPPPTRPQTAIWHFGWHVVDVKKNEAEYKQHSVKLLPLYTTDEGGSVFVSSDTWPGLNGSLGLTKAEIADAKANGVQPTHGAGFAYLEAPDGAIVEYQGNLPAERFNHVHMFQKDPFCAELWYHQHLNAPLSAGSAKAAYTEATCRMPLPERSWPALERRGMLRMPAGIMFDDVALAFHVQQDPTPLAPTRGQLYDHIGLSVQNLDAWIAKLRQEHVKFLTKPYQLGGIRAVMIEGPSREALELVEIK